MKKVLLILTVGLLFTACKSKEEASSTSTVGTIDSIVVAPDTTQTPEQSPLPARPAGKLAATATDEIEGKDGRKISFTYDNNASTVSFVWKDKPVRLTSEEKISDMPNKNGRTYTNGELTYNDKDRIKITDKSGKIVFEAKK